MTNHPSGHSLPKGVFRYQVGPEAVGLRLDQALARCHPGISRSLARRFIDLGGVHLDGRRMRRCGLEVSLNQQLELFVDGLGLEPFSLAAEQILFHDQDLLVIDKPAGIDTQPTPARYRGTLYDAVQRYLGSQAGRGARKPGIGMVQRLDRNTSGVIVFSIHRRAHKPLTQMFSGRAVDKRYLAVVHGQILDDTGVIRSKLARKRATNRTVSVERGGREAETRFHVRARHPAATLVEITLVTGRTHQIRAHFSETGHPLVGDLDYGGSAELETLAVPRQMLHAVRTCFPHPVSGRELVFEAPLPEDFKALLHDLGTFSPPEESPSGGGLNVCSAWKEPS